MPALGDHIKVEIDEFEKTARAYMLAIPTSATKSPKSQICHKNQQWHQNMICLDMAWYILTGITGTAFIIFWMIFITASITVTAVKGISKYIRMC